MCLPLEPHQECNARSEGRLNNGATRYSRYEHSRDNAAALCHNLRSRPTFRILEATWLQLDSPFMLPPPPISIRSSLDCQKRFNKAPCYSTHDIVPAESEGKAERAVWFGRHQGFIRFHTGHRSLMRRIPPREHREGFAAPRAAARKSDSTKHQPVPFRDFQVP